MLYGYQPDSCKKPATFCKCKCDCGNEKIIRVSNIVRGFTKSCGCFEKESRYTRDHGEDLTGQQFKYLTVIKKTDKRAKNGSIIWRCQCQCGNVCDVCSGDLKRGRIISCGCEMNHTSFHEQYIRKILDRYNVNYKFIKIFLDCRNPLTNKPLRFDFYLNDYDIAIEYDGIQHYESVPFWGGDEGLKYRQSLDEIKNQYCKKYGIKLIRIPYTYSIAEIERKIYSILNPATTTAV